MASPDRKSFLLRIDPKLWSELESWAQQELRSINGQVEFILREAVLRRRRVNRSPSSALDSAPESTASDDPPQAQDGREG